MGMYMESHSTGGKARVWVRKWSVRWAPGAEAGTGRENTDEYKPGSL